MFAALIGIPLLLFAMLILLGIPLFFLSLLGGGPAGIIGGLLAIILFCRHCKRHPH